VIAVDAPSPRIEQNVHPSPSTRDGSVERRRARNALVEAHLPFVDRYVRRYSGRGVARDELRQIALLALVQAAERFDPTREVEFRTFAGSTIDGTLKRHFRDGTWAVRPPRALQELHLRLRQADDELGQQLGRRPTVAELAAEVDVDVDRVHRALEAGAAHGSVSVDAPAGGDEEAGAEPSFLGAVDRGYVRAEARLVLEDAVAGLDEREQEVLRLRFEDQLSQQEISDRMGVSQSYLSRFLRSTLVDLRRQVGELVDG
jgi:RNA polymerase sigma-B factor